MIVIDAFGETCPKPVIRAMKALAEPGADGSVRVLVDNTVAVENLKRLAASKQGSAEVAEVEGGWAVTVSGVPAELAGNPQGTDAALAEAGIACPVPGDGDLRAGRRGARAHPHQGAGLRLLPGGRGPPPHRLLQRRGSPDLRGLRDAR